MRPFLTIGLALLLLGGCTAQQAGYLEAKTQQIRAAHDTSAKGLKAGLCAMSLGAYHRNNTAAEKAALDVFCDPHAEPAPAVTIEGLQEFLDFQQYLRAP